MEVFCEIPGVARPVGPYSPATAGGGLIFCSGQIAVDPNTGRLVSGGVAEQTEQVLRNIDTLLRGLGLGRDRILFTSIFLTDMSHWKTVNELYGEFVDRERPPARQTVAVKELPLGALVEISVIAERAERGTELPNRRESP